MPEGIENITVTDVAEPESKNHLERNNILLVVLGAMAFGMLRGFEETWSFLAGGVLTIINLRLLKLIVRGLTSGEPPSKGRMVGQVVVKFAGVLGLLAFLMIVVKPMPIPFLLGLSTLVVAISLEGIFGLFRKA